jgi:hypothetical protein
MQEGECPTGRAPIVFDYRSNKLTRLLLFAGRIGKGVKRAPLPEPSSQHKHKKPFDLHAFLTAVENAAFRIVATILLLLALYKVLRGELHL